jgi:hypothetical protein
MLPGVHHIRRFIRRWTVEPERSVELKATAPDCPDGSLGLPGRVRGSGLHAMLPRSTTMDEPAYHRLEVPNVTPATDTTAHVLRWVGLVGGLGLCAVGIASVLA